MTGSEIFLGVAASVYSYLVDSLLFGALHKRHGPVPGSIPDNTNLETKRGCTC